MTSAIQRRTRIFERALPPQLSDAQRQMQLRLAVQLHTSGYKWIVLATVVLPIVIVGVVIATLVAHKAKPANRPPTWQGTNSVLVADSDGDGTPEIVGRARQVFAGDIVRVIALDLKTGKPKWQSEPLGTYSETHAGTLALAGDLIVFASDRGEVQTLELRDGTRKWRTKLDERVETFCAAADGAIIAITADGMMRTLARADGAVAGAPTPIPGKDQSRWDRPEPCPSLPDDRTTAFDRVQERMRHHSAGSHDAKLGIDIDVTLDAPGGLKVHGAQKSEGTRVSLVVAVDDKGAEKWRATAAEDSLASTGAPRYLAVGEREACIIYYSSKYRIACFALADGKRLWDIEAPSFHHGLVPIGRSLVLAQSTDLQVVDIETGKLRWKFD